MELSKAIQRLLPRLFLYTIIGIPAYLIAISFTLFPVGSSLIIALIAVALMFMGQISSITTYRFAYPLYYVSCLVSISLALFIWMTKICPLIEVYLVALAALFGTIHIFHSITRKQVKTFPLSGLFSIFMFALLIILSPGAVAIGTNDLLFVITLILLISVAVQNLNSTYRTRVLCKNFDARNVDECLLDCERRLLDKFRDSKSDVNLLCYYLRSSLESFIEGDFERSFMDCFKIAFDSKGKAFKSIYVIPDVKKRAEPFKSIRDNLSHPRIKQNKDEEKNVDELEKLKKIKKKLFEDTVALLKIVKVDFIEASLVS